MLKNSTKKNIFFLHILKYRCYKGVYSVKFKQYKFYILFILFYVFFKFIILL